MIVDDFEVFRLGLRTALDEAPGFQVVGEASDARSAYELDEKLQPDLMILDVRLPGTDGVAATRELLRRNSARRIALLSGYANPDMMVEGLQAGASGFFLKHQPLDQMLIGIRRVVEGETYVPPSYEQVLADRRRRRNGEKSARAYDLLSPREREVFRMLVRGLSNVEVGRELCISVKTVESHREHILAKLGIHSIVELVRYAAREQMLDD
jgi:DNA-binding NarL/FixJ family response regulator